MFCSSCGMECPSTANFCHQCGQQLNLSQVSNKAASSVDKEKLLKEYFHRGYPYAAIVSLLEKRYGVRIHLRTLKRKLKKRSRKLRPRELKLKTNTSKTKTFSLLFSLNFYVKGPPSSKTHCGRLFLFWISLLSKRVIWSAERTQAVRKGRHLVLYSSACND